MKQIAMIFNGDDLTFDFSGFIGKDCKTEEEKIRLLMAAMGIRSDDDGKTRKDSGIESEPSRERQ